MDKLFTLLLTSKLRCITCHQPQQNNAQLRLLANDLAAVAGRALGDILKLIYETHSFIYSYYIIFSNVW